MAGKIIADTIEASGSQISLNVGNVTVLTASSTGLTLIPTTNVNINLTNSIVNLTSGNVTNPSLTFSGNTSTGIFMPAANTIAFTTAGTEDMRIDSSGRVGIGTNSPSYVLDVQGTTATQRIASTTGTNAAYKIISNTGQNFYIGLDNSAGNQLLSAAYGATLLGSGAYPMVFGTNNTERMRIDSTGEVLIGATAASQTADGLFVKGKRTATSNQWNFQVYTTLGQATFSCRDDYYFRSMGIYDRTAGGAANITIDGSGYLYRSTSSIKYKRDVTNYDKGIAEVMQLRPVYYKSKVNGPDGNQINTQFAGLIAEELDEIGLDEFVVKDKDGEVESIHYGNMVALLTKAIQELKVIVDAQAVEIAALKAK